MAYPENTRGGTEAWLIAVILVIVVLGALGVLAWSVLLSGDPAADDEPIHASETDRGRMERELETLQARVERLDMDAAARSAGERVPLEPESTLREEVEFLKARIAELEESIVVMTAKLEVRAGGGAPDGLTADALVELIGKYRGTDAEWKKQRKEIRKTLLVRFLEEFPSEPKAPDILGELIAEHIYAGDHAACRSTLEHYAPLVNLDPLRRLRTSANIHLNAREFDAARREYDRILHLPDLDERERAGNMFWHAYTYYDEGNYEEACSRFQALIDHYGPNPPPRVKNSLAGARTHLEKARKYLAERGSGDK